MKLSEAQFAFIRRIDSGIELRIKVVPGARRSEIVGILGDRLKIKVTSPPAKGLANAAVLEIVAAWLGTKDVTLVSGHSSAEKALRVAGLYQLNAEQIEKIR